MPKRKQRFIDCVKHFHDFPAPSQVVPLLRLNSRDDTGGLRLMAFLDKWPTASPELAVRAAIALELFIPHRDRPPAPDAARLSISPEVARVTKSVLALLANQPNRS